MRTSLDGYSLDDLFSLGKEQGLFIDHARVPDGVEVWSGDSSITLLGGMAERYVRSVFQAWMTGAAGGYIAPRVGSDDSHAALPSG